MTEPIKRYSMQPDYANGVGIPTMMPSAEGEYALYADHAQIVTGYQLHEDLLIARLKRAEGIEG